MKRPSANISVVQLLSTAAGKIPANKSKLEAIVKGKDAKHNKKAGLTSSKGDYGSEQKDWIQSELQFWCNKNLLELHKEFRFAKPRLWKFDWAITSPALIDAKIKIAIEYEGIFSAKSRHITKHGFMGDVEKYNEAVKLGWNVVRLTAQDYKSIIETLNRII